MRRPARDVAEANDSSSSARAERADLRSSGSNNPHHRGAWLYNLNLALPIVSAIRRQEARAISDLIARYAPKCGSVIEVGPGTGFYTVELARRFPEVEVVEESARMVELLRRRLARANLADVTVVHRDFRALALTKSFDLAVAIGVLDYVAEPGAFVASLCTLARQAVIVTAPQRGLWGTCFTAAGRLRGVSVYCHDQEAGRQWRPPGWGCDITETGLRTRFTRGMTLVAAFEPT